MIARGPGQVGLPRSFTQLPQVGRDANVPGPVAQTQAAPLTFMGWVGGAAIMATVTGVLMTPINPYAPPGG
jgi:hypothetical protein